MKVGVRRDDAIGLSKWSVSDYLSTNRLRRIWPPSFVVDAVNFLTLMSLSLLFQQHMFYLFFSINVTYHKVCSPFLLVFLL